MSWFMWLRASYFCRQSWTSALPMVLATVVCVRVAADCSSELCDEIRYYGTYTAGTGPHDCGEYQTDGGDALLAANTMGDSIRTSSQIGGGKEQHPSIKVRHRSWSSCTVECGAGNPGSHYSGATVAGTAGQWGGWTEAWYCKLGL